MAAASAHKEVIELRIVTTQAVVAPETCIGCRTCEKVCPTESIKIGANKKAEANTETCTGWAIAKADARYSPSSLWH